MTTAREGSEGVPDKAIPSLEQWLGDGPRGEGFDAWVRETLYMERAVETDTQEAFVRISRTMAEEGPDRC